MLSQASQPKKTKKLEGLILFNKFKVTQRMGSGCFGEVYLVQSQEKTSKNYAIKTEPIGIKQPQVLLQAQIYKFLHSEGEVKGIPKVYASGTEGKRNSMIMDLLGPSLQEILNKNGPFSYSEVQKIGLQLLERIQCVHEKCFIHRDIKPQNIAFGLGEEEKTLFLFDFGLANKFLNRKREHIPFKEDIKMTGTSLYISVSMHQGKEQSRRDDVESIGYVLLHLLLGQLPWQNLRATSMKQISDLILSKKIEIGVKQLEYEIPMSLMELILYARKLSFTEKPDYGYVRGLLEQSEEKKEQIILKEEVE